MDTADVDLDAGLLMIRQSKFGKSRVVPVDDSTREALRQHLAQRTALCRQPSRPAFLLSEHGRHLRGIAPTPHTYTYTWTFDLTFDI